MNRRAFLKRSVFASGLAAVALTGPGLGLALASEPDEGDELETAHPIRRRRFRVRGVITAIGADPITIEVRGRQIVVDEGVNPELVVSGELAVDAQVAVWGFIEADGDQTIFIAQRVRVGPPPADGRRRFRVVGLIESWDRESGVLVVNGRTILLDPEVVPELDVDSDLEVGDRVFVAGVVIDETAYAAIVRAPGDAPRPEGERFHRSGRIEEVGDGFILLDREEILTDRARVRGVLTEGRRAQVWGLRLEDGTLVAHRILVLPERGFDPPRVASAGRGRAQQGGQGLGRGVNRGAGGRPTLAGPNGGPGRGRGAPSA